MLRSYLLLSFMLVLAACGTDEPRDKQARYDPTTGELVMPYPCPDWSQAQGRNYGNQLHSNYGCAVNTNSALQVADPRDLYQGHGTRGPDTETSVHTIEQYRAGVIPKPLLPQEDNSTSGGS